MKKIVIILCTILLITGCQNNQEQKEEIMNENTTKEKTIEEQYVDNNPIKVGIYMYTNSYTNRKQLTEYSTSWNLNVDLCSLEIFYTNEPEIPGSNFKTLWNTYKNNYENIDNYRIGYQITFETKNQGTIDKYILSPKDTNDIYKYLQIYLYDDIHQEDGAWYSHITEEEYTNNNILTSIKLTGSTITDEITSDITLTAFTYDEDDFDEKNQYRGISKSTITIKRS